MFDYSMVVNLFMKNGIKSYVSKDDITVGDVIVCISCLVNYYTYNSIVLRAIDMLFTNKPIHTYTYLYYAIPKHYKMPFSKKIAKFKEELPEEYLKLGSYFGWSEQETTRNKKLLELLYDKDELKKDMGVK